MMEMCLISLLHFCHVCLYDQSLYILNSSIGIELFCNHDFWGEKKMIENWTILFRNALCSRHSYVLLRARQAFWGLLRTGLDGDRGVPPRRGQVQLSIHHLQEPAVCLPAAAQVWQPEDLHQGKADVMPVSLSARAHWRHCLTLCTDWLGVSSTTGEKHCGLHAVPRFRRWRRRPFEGEQRDVWSAAQRAVFAVQLVVSSPLFVLRFWGSHWDEGPIDKCEAVTTHNSDKRAQKKPPEHTNATQKKPQPSCCEATTPTTTPPCRSYWQNNIKMRLFIVFAVGNCNRIKGTKQGRRQMVFYNSIKKTTEGSTFKSDCWWGPTKGFTGTGCSSWQRWWAAILFYSAGFFWCQIFVGGNSLLQQCSLDFSLFH